MKRIFALIIAAALVFCAVSCAPSGKDASRGRGKDAPSKGSSRGGKPPAKSAAEKPKSGKRPSGWAKPKAAKTGKPNSRKKK